MTIAFTSTNIFFAAGALGALIGLEGALRGWSVHQTMIVCLVASVAMHGIVSILREIVQ